MLLCISNCMENDRDTTQLSKGSSGIMENWWPWLNILFLLRLTSRPMVVSLNQSSYLEDGSVLLRILRAYTMIHFWKSVKGALLFHGHFQHQGLCWIWSMSTAAFTLALIYWKAFSPEVK